MFFKRPTYRQFDYQPRYYKPDKDPAERFKRRFEAQRQLQRKKTRPVIFWGIILLIIVYVYLYLAGGMG